MRLSNEKSRHLKQLIWRERLRKWVPALAVFAALFGLLIYLTNLRQGRADPTVDVRNLSGSVTAVLRPPSRGMSIVHVRLDDGRETDALSQLPRLLPPGSRVTMTESRHASGKLSYDVTGVGP